MRSDCLIVVMSPAVNQRAMQSNCPSSPRPPHPQPLSPRRAGGEGSQRIEQLDARSESLEGGRVSDFYPLAPSVSPFRLPSPPELVRGRGAGGEGALSSHQFAAGNAPLASRSQWPWCPMTLRFLPRRVCLRT